MSQLVTLQARSRLAKKDQLIEIVWRTTLLGENDGDLGAMLCDASPCLMRLQKARASQNAAQAEYGNESTQWGVPKEGSG
jgi:hypothetical protein